MLTLTTFLFSQMCSFVVTYLNKENTNALLRCSRSHSKAFPRFSSCKFGNVQLEHSTPRIPRDATREQDNATLTAKLFHSEQNMSNTTTSKPLVLNPSNNCCVMLPALNTCDVHSLSEGNQPGLRIVFSLRIHRICDLNNYSYRNHKSGTL